MAQVSTPPFLFRLARAQRRSPRGLGGPGKYATPSRYKDGGASHKEGAKKRWRNEEKKLHEYKKPKKAIKRAIMLANRVNTTSKEARQKAENTKKLRLRLGEHLEESRKRSRRAAVDYEARVTGGNILAIFASFSYSHQSGWTSPPPQCLRPQ
jgi:hypothetical protein